jgi:hypothetical protein
MLLGYQRARVQGKAATFTLQLTGEQMKYYRLQDLQYDLPARVTAYLSRAGGAELAIGNRLVSTMPGSADPGRVVMTVRYEFLTPGDKESIKGIINRARQDIIKDAKKERCLGARYPWNSEEAPPKRTLGQNDRCFLNQMSLDDHHLGYE